MQLPKYPTHARVHPPTHTCTHLCTHDKHTHKPRTHACTHTHTHRGEIGRERDSTDVDWRVSVWFPQPISLSLDGQELLEPQNHPWNVQLKLHWMASCQRIEHDPLIVLNEILCIDQGSTKHKQDTD